MDIKGKDLLRKYKAHYAMTIIELSILARQLGVDVDAISKKHADILFNELLSAIRNRLK